ncbi:signal peptidase I [Streptomyces sp. NPDC060194]|uniref:signal peptidase I n=1 Tax=Streptomyces sp. NPDC060194 TaxID=3347069 RepID=UPI00364EB292
MSSTERRTAGTDPPRVERGGPRGPVRGRLGGRLSGLAVALGCVLFLGGFAWGAWEYRPYTVPTDSMAPAVDRGDRVLARRIDPSEVRRGDVVVFEDAGWAAVPMVKRVVGVGGDEVSLGAQGLRVNGEAVEEPYLPGDERTSPASFDVAVPEGRLFLLGDHRSTSLDSRARLADGDRGTVPLDAVGSRVEAVAWPLDGMLPRPTGFAGLPGGVSEPGPLRAVLAAVAAGAVLILGGAAYGPLAARRRRRHG